MVDVGLCDACLARNGDMKVARYLRSFAPPNAKPDDLLVNVALCEEDKGYEFTFKTAGQTIKMARARIKGYPLTDVDWTPGITKEWISGEDFK